MKIKECATIQEKTGCGHLYAHIGEHQVHVNLGKSGSCPFAFMQAISSLINLSLKKGANWNDIINCTDNVHCAKAIPNGNGHTYSCIDAISKAIKEKYNITTTT